MLQNFQVLIFEMYPKIIIYDGKIPKATKIHYDQDIAN